MLPPFFAKKGPAILDNGGPLCDNKICLGFL